MRKLALAVLLIPLLALADPPTKPVKKKASPFGAGHTIEVLVGPATTTVPTVQLSNRTWIEIYNNGSAAIYCTIDGTTPVVNKSRPIAAGAAWKFDAGSYITPICVAATTQTTGAATIASEVQ